MRWNYSLPVLGLFLAISCSNHSHKISWEEMKQFCLPASPLQKTDPKPPLSAACENFLAEHIHFGDSFHEIDLGKGHKIPIPENYRKDLITLIYHLALYPAEWPNPDAKLFGQVPIQQFFAEDLWEQHCMHPEKSLNQFMFEYVMGAIDEFKLDPSTGGTEPAFYNFKDRSVTVYRLFKTLPVEDLTVIVHEARHSDYAHDADCAFDPTIGEACDNGTNKAYSWQMSYIYALLQGNEKNLLTPLEVQSLGRQMWKFSNRIYFNGAEWDQIRDIFQKDDCNFETKNAGPTYQQIVSLEPLSRPEYFSTLTPYCPLAEGSISTSCSQKLSTIIPFVYKENAYSSGIKDAAIWAIHRLITQPLDLGAGAKLFGIVPASEFLPQDLMKWAASHVGQPLNEFFIDQLFRSFQQLEIGVGPLRSGSVLDNFRVYEGGDRRNLQFNCLMDPQNPKTGWSCLAKLLSGSRLSVVNPVSLVIAQDPFCDEAAEFPSGWAATFLWTALQGGKGTWTPAEEHALQQVLCEQFDDSKLPLPPQLAKLRDVDCTKL